MEYLDIYDEDGNPLHQTKTITEIHESGDWHRTTHVWIMNLDKKILLQKRSLKMSQYPDYWDISSAGHVSAGEKEIDSALRETEEELGLKLEKEDLNFLGVVKWTEDGNREFSFLYLVEKDISLEDIHPDAEEVADIKFVTVDELKTMIQDKDSNLVPHPEEYKLLFSCISKNSLQRF